MQIKENTRYRLRNGEEVGDLYLITTLFGVDVSEDCPSSLRHLFVPMWAPDGRFESFVDEKDNDPQYDIVEEI